MSGNPIAFMSYVRLDDQHENGRLTQFRERLSGEVRIQTGEAFDIFQDRNDITWGQQWKSRVDDAIDSISFLIPIITPAFFKSPLCREELERFLKREEKLGRTDLILPVYYVECATLSNETKRNRDPLASAVAARQYADWRELRFEPLSSPDVGKRLAGIAKQIVDALERVERPLGPSVSHQVVQTAGSLATGATTGLSDVRSATEVSKPPGGPVQKIEVPTLVVDAFHRGDYSTLAEALAAAKPGTRMLVRPGSYQGAIVVDKPVEIIGDGDKMDVVFECVGTDVVLFKASMGRIANVTIRQTGGDAGHGVNITQGRLDLDECDISSQTASCIAIDAGADPRLRRNRIHDGAKTGVLVRAGGQGTLEDNEIFGNALAGVQNHGTIALRRNRIHDEKGNGVLMIGNGTLEDNQIFGNKMAGVQIKEGNATLRRNRIHDGESSGVFISANGLGTLDENDIFGNRLSGVEIRDGGNGILRLNRIHDGKHAGVFVWANGQGVLEDNDIVGNLLAGVEIRDGGNATLRHNRIHNGKSGGVFIHTNGQGALEDNEICGNCLAGVEIKEAVNVVLRRNHISKNESEGVSVQKGGGGEFQGNDLRDNSSGPWRIAAGSASRVKRSGNLE